MEFTVTAIAEKVEIDYNSEYPGDGIVEPGSQQAGSDLDTDQYRL